MRNVLLLVTAMTLHSVVKAQVCNGSLTWSQVSNSYTVNFTNTSTVTGGPSGTSTYRSIALYSGSAPTPANYLGGYNANNFAYPFAAAGQYLAVANIVRYDSSVTPAIQLCQDTSWYPITLASQPCAVSITSATGTANMKTLTANNNVATPGVAYTWNFGDGSPAATGVQVTHSYSATGPYTVTVTASNSTCTNSATTTVYVNSVAFNCANTSNGFSVGNGTNGMTMFTPSVTPSSFSGITVINIWNFGDGSGLASSGATGIMGHQYQQPGTYNVCLITRWQQSSTGAILCTDTTCQQVTPTTLNVINGYVVADSNTSGAQNSYKVWLISHDAGTMLLTAVDSVTVTGPVGAAFQFVNKPAGVYRTKAHRLNQTTGTLGYAPTYLDSSLTWSGAQTFSHNSGITNSGYIFLRPGLVTSGPGFVGGSVLSGANKGTADGDPVANQLVFLRNASTGALVQAVYTNAAGAYAFSNLPLGAYTVYPEEMNYVTTPSTPITLSVNSASVNGILFKKDDVNRDIKQVTTSVLKAASNTIGFTLTPNPTSGKLSLMVNEQKTGTADIRILSLTGQMLFNTTVKTGQPVGLDVDHLPAGVYSLTISTQTGASTARVVIAR